MTSSWPCVCSPAAREMKRSSAPASPRVVMLSRLDLRRAAAVLVAAGSLLYVGAAAGRIVARKQYVFLADYLRWTATPAPVPSGATHVLLLFADHFEPD